MHCFHTKSLMWIIYPARKPDLVFFPWQKWRNWVFGQLEPYITAKKTFGEAMKHFEALVLVIDITSNTLLPYQVTHGDRLLFPKTRHSLLFIAKMVRLGLGPTSAPFNNQKDPWKGHVTF